MSVLDDFVRMRRYRNRAAEFDELADIEGFSVAGRRYRTIARHYKELADREERLDKARVAERLELLRVKRQRAAAQAALAAESGAQILILRAGFRASAPPNPLRPRARQPTRAAGSGAPSLAAASPQTLMHD